MPGSSERTDARSGDAGPGSNMRAVIGCCLPVLAVLLGIGSLLVHYAITTPTSPYQVAFSAPGTACNRGDSDNSDGSDEEGDSDLILDQKTGEVLYCTVLPPIGARQSPRARGAFSAAEVGRVTQLSQMRAADGRLSNADRHAVERLVANIGRQHGYDKTSPTLMERLTWTVGLYSLIAGLAALIGLGLWGYYTDAQAGPPAH
ncbi:hypothetical protein [Streptomyces sp. NPDC017993]|uniref:hypothetical protein n=1 Tax=Streptomyces sp. NPDC017993 TaxID=3365027 RepID=UPI003798F46C